MSNQERVDAFLRGRGIPLSGQVADDIFNLNHFFAFIEVTRNSENLQVPSNKELIAAQEELKELGLSVEFILTDADRQDIEVGLRASMLHSFGEIVRNAFLTVHGNLAQVWLVPKEAIAPEKMNEIEDKVRLFLGVFDLQIGAISLTSTANLPSKFVCLKTVRQIAPASLEGVMQALHSKGFTIPSENWMSRMFDNLRKSGFVVRLKSGGYVLSIDGLKALGTSKNRQSADITRILAMARSGE
jgi:hypothetical protein